MKKKDSNSVLRELGEKRDGYLSVIANHEAELAAIRNKLAGIEEAMATFTSGPSHIPEEKMVVDKKRMQIKDYVLSILMEDDGQGVTVASIVTRGKKDGILLNSSSISSLLSRLKMSGLLKFFNERYYVTNPKNGAKMVSLFAHADVERAS